MPTLSSTPDKDKQELTIDQIILSAMEVGVMIEHCLIDSTREEQLPKYRKAISSHSHHLIDKIVSEIKEATAHNGKARSISVAKVLDILNKVRSEV